MFQLLINFVLPSLFLHKNRRAKYFKVLSAYKAVKVKKKAKIRNLYNQVPHLTQDNNGGWLYTSKIPKIPTQSF